MIPEWVHRLLQWHSDMFAALSPEDRARVYKQGNWIRRSKGLRRLDHTGFKVPVDPVYVPVSPQARALVARYSSSVVDPSEPEPVAPMAGPSTARTGQTPGGGPDSYGERLFTSSFLISLVSFH